MARATNKLARRILLVLDNEASGDLKDIAKHLSWDSGSSHSEQPDAVSVEDYEQLLGLVIGAPRKPADFAGSAVHRPSASKETAVDVFGIDDRNRGSGERSLDLHRPETRMINPCLRGSGDQLPKNLSGGIDIARQRELAQDRALAE